MSDKDLEPKFADLAEGILPSPQIAKVMELCWKSKASRRRRDREDGIPAGRLTATVGPSPLYPSPAPRTAFSQE